MREVVKDSNAGVRVAAAEALGRSAQPEALPLLRELVDGGGATGTAAFEALKSLPKTLVSASWPEALPLLRELAKDRLPLVRAAAAEALGHFAQPEARSLLRELAEDWHFQTAQDAATVALKSLPKTLVSASWPEALPLLRELAKDSDAKLRAAAAKALGRFAQPEARSLLHELAAWDSNAEVRVAAAEALGRFAEPEALPLLRELAKQPPYEVRVAAAEALGRFAQPEALLLLRELALVRDPQVAVDAILGLASLCSREELEAFLNQHDQELCASALAALDKLLYMPEWMKARDR
jgi:HEAT repeat protein